MALHYFKKRKDGFTLIEALVAISILMIAITGPMTLAQKGLMTATLSREEMTASFLAQDGIEAVKNIRDQIALTDTSGDWINRNDPTNVSTKCICTDTDLNCQNFAPTANWCNIDTTQTNLASPAAIYASTTKGANPLLLNRVSGNFSDFSLSQTVVGTSTPAFYRYINIRKSTTNPNEAAINVKVTFNSQYGPQSVSIKDFIYNYSDNL